MGRYLSWCLSWLLIVSSACGDDAPPTDVPLCDSDAQCDDGIFCNGSETCAPTAPGASALGCVAGFDPCEALADCIESSDICDDTCAFPDGDADGFDRPSCGGADCDDTDLGRYPGNTEICDGGRDEDCDLDTPGTLDRDADGFVDARCSNEGGAAGTDCNDLDPAIHPGGTETCNGLDDDCDGDVDEGVSVAGFLDADADGRGDTDSPITACPGTVRFATEGDDCDDGDITVNPAQNEICDSKDNDCDGAVDEEARPATWYEDADGDGYGTLNGERRIVCEPPAGFSILPTDCDDANDAVGPLAEEVCNGIDDDCNGTANFRVPGGGFEDDDGDGIADSACGGGDCDDLDAFVGDGLPEHCNGRDDDCDEAVDEGLTESDYYFDRDGDGHGAGVAMPMCADLPGLVPRGDDCDDADGASAPSAVERCDGIDNDCDGTIDEGAADACSGDNASYACVRGQCVVVECTGVFGDCDLRAANGCETILTGDGAIANCGSCGWACDSCLSGICDTTQSFHQFAAFIDDLGGTALVGVPAWAPLTVPPRTTISNGSGQVVINDVGGPTPVIIGGGYPTVFTNFGLEIDQGPLFAQVDTVTPLEPSELAAIEAAMGEPQRADRGILVIEAPGYVGVPTASVQIDRAEFTPLGFRFGRPLQTYTGDTELNRTTRNMVIGNVEPGPITVTVGGCGVSEPVGRIFAGAATLVTAACNND